ncbi:hypothetical protein [Enterococcus durans]|uniref:hypothetical protein n=1 Tax=Enterococcus durans TaxID=53345 RepID=UPI001BDB91B2|nr:hypothetical protein [Enterococcus durans]
MKKLFSAFFISMFVFLGVGISENTIEASVAVEQTGEVAKTFDQLTAEEQSSNLKDSGRKIFFTRKI